jgi:hypothetical protein
MPELSPRYWLYNTVLDQHSQSIQNFVCHFENLFRSLRENYIQSRLDFLIKQQRPGLTSSEDPISIVLQQQKKIKFTEKSRSKSDVYCFIDNFHKNVPDIKMGNPISVNPCSFDAVKLVLETLKRELEIPTQRKWSILGCDGLPYLLSQRVLQENIELQDLLIQPGLGHFEINMSKGIFISFIIIAVKRHFPVLFVN